MKKELRLRSKELDFWVDVHLRSFGDRWMAVADIAGEAEVGVGDSWEEAVQGALDSLGKEVTPALLENARALIDIGVRDTSSRH